MSFDSTTRNKLQRMVTACRRLLTEEFNDQLQSLYGIYADEGRILEPAKLTHLDDDHYQVATLLRDRIEHIRSGLASEKNPLPEAIRRVLREQAFTLLNRFAALRMAEERGLVQECVAQGLKSKGFQVFETVARSSLGSAYERYHVFIRCLFDELSLDLGVLFDRFSPFGLLFPREQALLRFFDALNDAELKSLWQEDETIGWIYQYFNDEAERKKMREESSAPRNSRELAVRNQFFTPRYVVQFLTDNTLGRIWYEMTRGQTRLKDQCQYLVRRPTEIFLKEGETAPASDPKKSEGLSQEELLKLPVHIPHRPLKDPRTILMLDPACGSMHFGLYAFDLFEVIYAEAWELEEKGTNLDRPPQLKSLHATFSSKDEFLRAVPKLIIEHNIHGIDIDPRCAQIAGLSLWLRAQKAWQRLGLKPADRPRITHSNVVCAEPMPGERELLKEFIEQQFGGKPEKDAIAHLVGHVFDKMQLAGEAGSLLKIEGEIRTVIAEAKAKWKARRDELFSSSELADLDRRSGAQRELPADFSRITDAEFFDRAEQLVYDALRNYAEQAENGSGFQRRLFAEDAARGFAFIDVCRKRYDAVVMNPPFGAEPNELTELIRHNYPAGKPDLYASFVERATSLGSANLKIGVLSSRTGFFLTSLEVWRRRYLLGKHHLEVAADLGLGVLDDALVEAAAYVVSAAAANEACFVSCLADSDKGEKLLRSVKSAVFFVRHFASFLGLPLAPVAYWVSAGMARLYEDFPQLEQNYGFARVGVQTSDDFRFLKGFWEVPIMELGSGMAWVPMAKGGEYQLFYDDVHLVVNWAKSAKEMKAFALGHAEKTGSARGNSPLRDFEFYFRGGITYPERTTSEFGPRILPDGCITGTVGPGVHIEGTERRYFILGWLTTRFVRELIEVSIGLGDAVESGSAARHYNIKAIGRLPVPKMDAAVQSFVAGQVRQIVLRCLGVWSRDETSRVFVRLDFSPLSTLKAMAEGLFAQREENALLNLEDHYSYEMAFAAALYAARGVTDDVDRDVGVHPCSLSSDTQVSENELIRGFGADEEALVNMVAGQVGFSRQITKKAFFADRRLELLALWAKCHPKRIAEIRRGGNVTPPGFATDFASNAISYLVGCAFGRWDIRYAAGEKAVPELPDPFAPLPVCPPGMLQNTQNLPARPEDVPVTYPISIPWDGILVDDPNHAVDIERRVREIIEIIWKGRADAIEHEACEILRVRSLRDYLRKPTGFFADHLGRYSRSRRQAPLYWPLSTSSGSYTLWIYYHRLNDQTLFRCVNEFVKPKLEEVRRDVERLQAKLRDAGTAKERQQLQDSQDLLAELTEFHDELLRVAGLPYKPNLNDGVLITASPLWKLFRLPKWQKDLKACWDDLSKGEYDWAHLAYTIWPDRVQDACKKDRSIAIAHGLEHLCEVKAPEAKGKRGRKKKDEQMELE